MASQPDPPLRPRPPALQVVFAGLVLWSSSVAVAVAADPVAQGGAGDPDRLLERELVDAALVARDEPDATVELLTLDTANPDEPGHARLTLLRRAEAWSVVDEASVAPVAPEGRSPWLVDRADGLFAVIAPLDGLPKPGANVRRSAIIPVTIEASAGRPSLRLGDAVEVDLAVTDAGTADVDGDGVPELVLVGDSGEDGDGCPASSIAVLSGRGTLRLDRQTDLAFEGWGGCSCLAWSALGEWDGRSGADLLAHEVEDCGFFDPFDPATVPRDRLVEIRLRDLSTMVVQPTENPGPVDDPPLVLDLDGDGRDELVVAGNGQLSVIDPVDGWRRLVVADQDVTLLDASAGQHGSRVATLTWVGPTAGRAAMGIESARIERVSGSIVVEGQTEQQLGADTPAEVEPVVRALWNQGLGNGLPNVMHLDIDRDGCPELVAPLLYAGCNGTEPPRVGPPYVATRPLLAIGSNDDRRLLVVQSAIGPPWFDWPRFDRPPWDPPVPSGLMDAPAPALAQPPGSWRQPPATPFLLAEAPGAHALPGSVAAIAAPVVDPVVTPDGSIIVHGPPGSRILLRAQELCGCHVNDPVDMTGSWVTFMSTEVQGFERDGAAQIPSSSGGTPGVLDDKVSIALVPDWAGSGTAFDGPWLVTAIALDALGRPSAPTSAVAAVDREPPEIQIDVPLLSPPWPFETSIGGSTEPGATIRLGDGPPVTAEPDGLFRLPTQLAPWPQTLTATAVDPSGNTTTTRVSVMGGLDVPQLLGPMLIVGVLVAALVSIVRGGGPPAPVMDAQPTAMRSTTHPGGDDGPVIEDLDEPDLRWDK